MLTTTGPIPLNNPQTDAQRLPSTPARASRYFKTATQRSLSPKSARRLKLATIREQRRVYDPHVLKREHVQAGHGCEFCGWTPAEPRLLHCHHIVPLACGGSDRRSNLVVLCPNHHALAHAAGRRRAGIWHGARTTQELFAALTEYERAIRFTKTAIVTAAVGEVNVITVDARRTSGEGASVIAGDSFAFRPTCLSHESESHREQAKNEQGLINTDYVNLQVAEPTVVGATS
jgi:5-methylcytosine-specific restriction endonuclease McrA